MDHSPPPIPQSVSGSGQIVKRIRKGTKSCVECRHRKIRCVWNSPSDSVCAGCQARGKDCVPQLYRRTTAVPKLSSRDRINRLEAQIASLTASVGDNYHPTRRRSSATHHEEDLSEMESSGEEEEEEEEEARFPTQGPAATPPHHLKFLFDNALIDPTERSEEAGIYLSNAKVSKRYLDHARAKLQRLMPSSEWASVVSGYATSWMSLYLTIFPSTTSIDSKEELIAQHEELSSPSAHPIAIAMFLLTFAITAMQAPSDRQDASPPSDWKDVRTYAREVAHVVETVIISHTGLAITVEGIEMTVMFFRLQLGLGAVRSLWLTMRRTVALAELIGLPRAWHARKPEATSPAYTPASSSPSSRDRLTQKVAIWEAICSSDRLSSMMFNLPAATSSHRFPPRAIMTSDGEVSVKAYIFDLSALAMQMQALDEDYITNDPTQDIYESVLSLDRRLNSLKSKTPKAWWSNYHEHLTPAFMAQYWHHYLVARIHLHAAMDVDEHDQYKYSRISCEKACETMAQLYPNLRRTLPPGFFLCRIVDMQIFTAAAFLLLSAMGQGDTVDTRKISMARMILEAMDTIPSNSHTGDFLQGASATIRSLLNLAQDGSSSSQDLTLRIPLLGTVRIGRKRASPPQNAAAPQHSSDFNHQTVEQPAMTTGFAADQVIATQMNTGHVHFAESNQQQYDTSVPNTLPWLMELDMNASSLQDPFLAEDFTQFDQWMGLDSMPIGSL